MHLASMLSCCFRQILSRLFAWRNWKRDPWLVSSYSLYSFFASVRMTADSDGIRTEFPLPHMYICPVGRIIRKRVRSQILWDDIWLRYLGFAALLFFCSLLQVSRPSIHPEPWTVTIRWLSQVSRCDQVFALTFFKLFNYSFSWTFHKCAVSLILASSNRAPTIILRSKFVKSRFNSSIRKQFAYYTVSGSNFSFFVLA